MRKWQLVMVGTAVVVAGLVASLTAQPPIAWTVPSDAFDSSLASNFINNEFLLEDAARQYPENTVMAFSAEKCPEGWQQLTDDEVDDAPLYYAFGLLVDADGTHRSSYVRVPACVKR